MAFPNANIPDTAPFNSVYSIVGTPVVYAGSSLTNTATSATAVSQLTSGAFIVPALTKYLKVTLTGDSVSNSGANNVIISAWIGTVGSGTSLGTDTNTAQSGAKAGLDMVFIIPTTGLTNTSITINIGMHGSGAGTNTITTSATSPLIMLVESL